MSDLVEGLVLEGVGAAIARRHSRFRKYKRVKPFGIAARSASSQSWLSPFVKQPRPRSKRCAAYGKTLGCHYREDTFGKKMELRFLRTVEKKEIDFVVLENSKPLFAVETKTGERELSPHVSYFKDRVPIPKFYQVHLGSKDYALEKGKIHVLPFRRFVKEIEAP